ncbi:MAG: TonB-dependent receptor, partial [Bacteroidetes bacterium HGW-Bacteroidetes-22]
SENLLLRTNIAAAYRTPNLAELTSNGQHELRYETGDQNLVPENAYEADLSLHYHKNNFTADIAGFYNIVNNYIFIAPTGEMTSTGIPVFRYKQSNATLFGGEAGIHLHPEALKWLHTEATFSSVIGRQQNGDYLPFVPAHKFRLELRGEKEKFLQLHKAFASVNSTTAFNQNNAAPDETTTPGYTLFDFGIGANLKIQNQEISFKISINNLLDTKYIDHLSTLKEVNYNNAGRNITFSIKIPFGIADQYRN